VIVTISSADLHGNTNLASLSESGDCISEKLRAMRDQFGMCFPVYVIVTKCDLVRGFRTFVDTQLRHHLNEIFGWSNPYTLDAPFDPDWVQQAFAQLQQVLANARTDALASARHSRSSRALIATQ